MARGLMIAADWAWVPGMNRHRVSIAAICGAPRLTVQLFKKARGVQRHATYPNDPTPTP
ncbi:hypothetical protein ABT160_23660 [Streptomyces sp. NPDC001941]|uniref:hypothetical protein n=1 Tax=Streptomyces sp. NPDC001941 TaxID=3154659 RepID=UPI00332C0A3C